MAEKPAIIARRFRSRNLQHIIASVTDYDALRRDDDRWLFSHLDSSMGIHPGPCTAASGDIGIDGAQAGALIQARRSLPHPRGSMGAIGQIERDLLSGNHARQLRGSQFAAPFQTPLTDQPEEFLSGRCDGSKGGGAGADDAVVRRDHARVAQLQTLRGERCRRGPDRKSTSELQSLMRISYAVFCLKKKNTTE